MGRKAAQNMYSSNANKIGIQCICWSYSQRKFTCVHMHYHWTLQWRNMNSYPINFKIQFNLILMSLPKSPKQHLPFRFPDHNFMLFLFPPFTTWPSICTAMASSLLSFYTRRIIETADNRLSDHLQSIQPNSEGHLTSYPAGTKRFIPPW